MKRTSLGYKDFEKLVSGKVVEQEGVKIILKDIGYAMMIDIIKREMERLQIIS